MQLFQLARVWVLLGHILAFGYAFSVAALHVYFLLVPYVGGSTAQLDLTIPSFFVPTIVAAVIGCIGHLILFVHALVETVRRVCVSRRTVKPVGSITIHSLLPKPTESRLLEVEESRGRLHNVRMRATRHKMAFLRFWSKYHAEITRLFILWEVAFQTFQAHKISQLITSQWINSFVTLVIVINCWFSPVLHYFLGARPKAYVRLNRLVIDSCLDMVYTVGIPFTIFYPYYRDFEGSPSIFPAHLYFTDTWYINAISELRQLFITSWLDFVSKITGAVALHHRLYTILNAVSAAQREAEVRASQRDLVVQVPDVKSRVTRLLDVILLVWGATVLTLHTHAAVTSYAHHSVGCLLEMRPWGVTQYTCAALEVSCSQWHTTGDRDKLESVITTVNPAYVQVLIMSNCPALEMPTAIQSLHGLLLMKMYNTTISEWGDDAALTNARHPILKNLYFSRVNVPSVPLGLLSKDFPKTIWAIMFCMCKVTDYPDMMPEAWANVFVVAVEGDPALVDLPRNLARLPYLGFFGLRHNGIQLIPDQLLAGASFMMLDVAGNPLTQLPASLGSIDRLQTVDVRCTNVSEIPSSWAQMKPSIPRPPTVLRGGDTPLCANPVAAATTFVPWLTLDCTPLSADISPKFAYPIDDEDTWRRANQ